MIVKYDRVKGVPPNHYMLMKIVCFGEMGGPYYEDKILYHSGSKSELERFCEEKKYRITGAWCEHFIKDKC
jgi:hypothetical protein